LAAADDGALEASTRVVELESDGSRSFLATPTSEEHDARSGMAKAAKKLILVFIPIPITK
jgi:hypothetical protein